MKLTKEEFKKFIREEAIKQIKIMEIEEKKKNILQQLNEMGYGHYEECSDMDEGCAGADVMIGGTGEEDEIEEIFGLGTKKTPEELQAIGLDIVKKHSGKRDAYKSWLTKNPEIAKKYLEFFGKNPKVMSVKWVPEKGEFVDASSYSLGGGGALGTGGGF